RPPRALVAGVASTSRSPPPPDGSGLDEMLQRLPFQRSITGRWMGRVPVSARPTAQALLAESASVPQRTLENWVRLGLDTAVQVAAVAGVASASSATARRMDHRARWVRDRRGRSEHRMAPPDAAAPLQQRNLDLRIREPWGQDSLVLEWWHAPVRPRPAAG